MKLNLKIKVIVLSVFSIVTFVILLKVLFDLLGADEDNSLVSLLNNSANFFSEPFLKTIYVENNAIFNINYLISAFIYFSIGVIMAEIISSIFSGSITLIIRDIVDALFKILEFVLFLRIIFDFFRINELSYFSELIYNLTNWADSIFNIDNIIDARLNLEILIVLIIVVILDIFTESFLSNLFSEMGIEEQNAGRKVVKTFSMTTPPAPTPNVNNYITVKPAESNPSSTNQMSSQQTTLRQFRSGMNSENQNKKSLFQRIFRR